MKSVQALCKPGNHLLTLEEFSPFELSIFIKLALEQKNSLKKQEQLLQGKVLGMIFDKSSTRTRVSFEVGMLSLGGHAIFLNGNDLQLGRGETIHDTAKTLSQYVDGIMIRTHEHEKVEGLAKHASIPVINGLTDQHHPCQALADFLTIYETTGSLTKWKLTYVGEGNNVCHSLLIGTAMLGGTICYSTPKTHKPAKDIVAKALAIAKLTGATIIYEEEVQKACENADFIYTDVWNSMGFEEEENKHEIFLPYQVNNENVKFAKSSYQFMHCLPAHRGEEVTADIIDGKHSVVFNQAGNRMFAQKSLLLSLLA